MLVNYNLLKISFAIQAFSWMFQRSTEVSLSTEHSFDNNVEFMAVDHPVLGGLASLLATADE